MKRITPAAMAGDRTAIPGRTEEVRSIVMKARMLLLALALLLAGCTRSFYRRSADKEIYPTIAEHEVFPTDDIGRTWLEPPAGSRLGNPFDPDHPPKPPDDPAAAMFMARPGGLKGAREWEKDRLTDAIEPPGWEESLGLDESGTLKLDQDRAVEIALDNSREYQSALEAVYRIALALTLNRYEFALHWIGTTATNFTHFGADATETNTLDSETHLGFTRQLAAGGQLIVDFANSMVWEFTGHTSLVQPKLTVTLMQPLLRNFGRKVRLESLTQGERNLLYAVRDFGRFRKQFWAGIAIGGSTGGGGISIGGGAAPAITGVTTAGAGGGGTFFGGGGGGYLDLLLAMQSLRNTQDSLRRQEQAYRYYEALYPVRATVVQRDQFYQSFLSARQSVVNARSALEGALDSYKLRLGLPPRLRVELDDSLLKQFELVDASMERLRDNVDTFQRDRLKELGKPPTAAALRKNYDALHKYAEKIRDVARLAAADLERWGRQLQRPPRDDEDPEQRARVREAYEKLTRQLPEVSTDLDKRLAEIDKHRAGVNDDNREAAWTILTEGDAKSVLALLDTVIAVQTDARIYLIALPEAGMPEAAALAIARENRLDLQNRLAMVTDAWRQVWVAANALRGDLKFTGTATVTDWKASQYTAGIEFDGPLNRLAERNAYRASLINYEQAKRSYIELSDQIESQVRQDLRQLDRLRVDFDTARQQLLAAARQVESVRLNLAGPAAQQSPTATLDLLQGLSSLLFAQNALATNYINYEQQRVQLLLDLEELQLDERGYPTNDPTRPTDPIPSPDGSPQDAPTGIPSNGGRASPQDAPAPRKPGTGGGASSS